MVNVECQFEYDDEVFDVRYGWGRIDHFERVVNEETGKVYYNAKVKFKSTKNYIYYDDSSVRTLLSHRAYESFDEVVSIDWDKRIGTVTVKPCTLMMNLTGKMNRKSILN